LGAGCRILFLLTLFSSFTGYLLPWDQLAFLGDHRWLPPSPDMRPLVGKDIQFLLLGDANVGQEALLQLLRPAHRRAAAGYDDDDCGSFLAHSQRRRAVAS
jgi:quinol-cytochrome oxidoreductase complex cytochrome b subunit